MVISGRRYYDPQPLVRQVILDMRPEILNNDVEQLDSSARIAEVLGVTPRAVKRWKNGAKLTHKLADQLASKIGLCPEMLWDDWLHDAEPAR